MLLKLTITLKLMVKKLFIQDTLTDHTCNEERKP